MIHSDTSLSPFAPVALPTEASPIDGVTNFSNFISINNTPCSMSMERVRAVARTLPALDLTIPKVKFGDYNHPHMPQVGSPCYHYSSSPSASSTVSDMETDSPLNLSSTPMDYTREERDTCTPPKTPTTPSAVSYKKYILKRYGE